MPRLVFTIFGLIGLALLLWGGWLCYHGVVSGGWPTVPGQVTQAAVHHARGSSDPSRVGTTTDSADIAYSYAVDGQSYVGSRISFAYFYSSNVGSETADYLLRYPVRKQVAVHYDPGNPAEAVLEPGVGPSIFILMGIGAFFGFIGLGLPALTRRDREVWR
jgi:hypothetical protein